MNLENGVLQIHIEDIIPNRFQPRLNFDEQGLKELSDSIKEHGIIQPLVLRKLGNKYEIIAGERRYKAAQMAGLTTVPAVIANIDDNKSAEVALVENIQRRDLTAIEEARSYKNLLDKGYLTQEQLAKRMGLSQPSIANKLRLLNLDEEVQQALLEEKISERHARTLLTLDDKEAQKEWLHRIVNERLTVRQLDIELKKMKGNNNLIPKDEVEEASDEVPLVKNNLSVDDIRSNSFDINDKSARLSAEELMKPQEVVMEEVETLDDFGTSDEISDDSSEEQTGGSSVAKEDPNKDDESFVTATKVPEFNIATPDSASSFISKESMVNDMQKNDSSKFFNFNDIPENDTIPQMESASNDNDDNKLEVFDAPTYSDSSAFVEMDEKEEKEEKVLDTFEENNFSTRNVNGKFFGNTSDNGPQTFVDAKKDEDIDPMDAVSKLTPDYQEEQKVTKELVLKDAIARVRSTIQELGGEGFYINVEEIDYPDNYQITIQIDKGN